jgi:hypothetical protein
MSVEELGFGSFPVIGLRDGVFTVSGETQPLGSAFTFVIVDKPRDKFVYRALPVRDNRLDVAFSYDGETTTRGQTIQQFVDEAAARGKQVEQHPRPYKDVPVKIVDPTCRMNGRLALLSIPEMSISRLGALIAQLSTLGLPSSEVFGKVQIKASVGALITKAIQSFNPWQFEVL